MERSGVAARRARAVSVFLAGLWVWATAAGAGGQEVGIPLEPGAAGGAGAMMDRAGALVSLAQAHAKYPAITGAGYTIAILDTGVDYTHPALAGRYLGGYDFVNGDADPNDDHGHGTHVAGVALSNDLTYTGIAPGANFVVLKVLNSSGEGTWANVEAGLQWVINNRATYNIVAVNMSIGTDDIYNTPQTGHPISNEMAALKNAGVFVAAAAGNAWYQNSPDPPGVVHQGVAYPAADPSAVAVGSVWAGNFGSVTWSSGAMDRTTAADRLVSHSNRSTALLDILAPGAIITSSNDDWEGAGADWVTMSGTSVATPAVASLAVLIRQAYEDRYGGAVPWPAGDWVSVILATMRATGVIVHDGDDEDDNVANLNAAFIRIDVLAALDAAMPEPASGALLGIGWLALLVRRRGSRARGRGYHELHE